MTLVGAIVSLAGLIVWGVRFLAERLVTAITELRQDVRALHGKLHQLHQDSRDGISTIRTQIRTSADQAKEERRELAEALRRHQGRTP